MKDKIFGVLQRVGRSFMLPIAILPIAGLFLGVGGSFTNETMLETYNLTKVMGPGTFIYALLTVLKAAGDIVFGNLPLIFAIGVAIGMAKREKEVAALAGAIAFFIMHASIGAMITISGGTESMLAGSSASVLGITSLQMGVFGGIIVGLGVAALHNRYYKIVLPQVLSFFGGTRFVPIVSAIVYMIVGILMFYIWPPVQTGIYSVGDLVRNSGYGGTMIYGIMERALIPFGLHHVFYLPFWQTAVGGTAQVGGQLIEGAQNIFFAELGATGIEHFNVEATRFMSGKFPLMIFGLPGAALAMYHCAKTNKRKIVGGLLLSAALTSMLTGITEPIEFTFLFVAPILYVIHCVFAGAAYMIMHMLNVGVGMTFSGGFIDMFLFGILQGNDKTNWLNIVLVGIVYFAVYYFLFKFLIMKFDFKTPGREEDDQDVKLYTRADVNAAKEAKAVKGDNGADEVSPLIVKGLGGSQNISDVDCCATRLRVTVNNPDKVKDDILKQSGAAGVVKKGNGIQVIYGPRVTVIKSNLEDYLAEGHHEEDSEDSNMVNDNKEVIHAPIEGRIVTLEDVNDGVFSAGMLGKGIAIEPMKGRAVSPVDGTVSTVFETKHAIVITSDSGAEILIHVGMDTVQLNGKHYTTHVKDGDKVKVGDLLVEFDMDKIKEKGYRLITPIIITNTDSYKAVSPFATGDIKEKEAILNIE
ncbi:PTS system IIA component (Glc family) /PTS system IIB component (Glc family) /PTS system IIC component (Glc family) [Mobilisporobacter senegalensis]|uniref:PTS system IIA component (Glc family) /PTS system IIB component (Glc family) /PTS system IIC component (Glc family) n=1 Tax=Mobilisporobacter senegalensis TaxID=1329262 RepID=A0A3N1XI71_9FIRM|nr:PTS transporter subunit IIABC [Mobilisporobacter senegalensis]ROR26375.1 PTS system IIA component (Glc family) /PTS system IIB component (Glc family) /PTS system IIC component (Glc family) [Mobilisporobacter senegalensis]